MSQNPILVRFSLRSTLALVQLSSDFNRTGFCHRPTHFGALKTIWAIREPLSMSYTAQGSTKSSRHIMYNSECAFPGLWGAKETSRSISHSAGLIERHSRVYVLTSDFWLLHPFNGVEVEVDPRQT